MILFPCPYLQREVIFTLEREQHISEHHPDLLPQYKQSLAETLLKPLHIRRSRRANNAWLFYRWFDEIRKGNYVVVSVITDNVPDIHPWIITAHLSKRLPKGDIVWQRT
ncbi:MAG: hypothetical protein DRR19_27810 [Candidatus Parabeggiatoa sp. nov. 1]|nr:MAG: hypothetical protein DRR19_27810 [Gammaproteobacteria bacterium]